MSTERQLGDRWAAKLRARGCFVQKIPASSVAGFPDWLVCGPAGIELIEAKRATPGRYAYKGSALTKAQQWFLRQIARRQWEAAWVLVLAEDGYVELLYSGPGQRSLLTSDFNLMKESYDAKS